MNLSPKNPFDTINTLSPLFVTLETAISIAKVPEPATTKHSPSTFNNFFKSITNSLKSFTNAGSPKATVSLPSCSVIVLTVGVGPGIITNFWFFIIASLI